MTLANTAHAVQPIAQPSLEQDFSSAKPGSEKAAWERLHLMGEIPADAGFSPTKAKDGAYSRQLKAALAKPARKAKKPKKQKLLSHTLAMECFNRCVYIQCKKERNSFRRRVRLLKAAKDLGLAAYINRVEIAAKVLEAKQ